MLLIAIIALLVQSLVDFYDNKNTTLYLLRSRSSKPSSYLVIISYSFLIIAGFCFYKAGLNILMIGGVLVFFHFVPAWISHGIAFNAYRAQCRFFAMLTTDIYEKNHFLMQTQKTNAELKAEVIEAMKYRW